VKKVLSYASNQVTDIEYNKYVIALNAMIARGQEPDTSAIRSIRVYKQNKNINQIVVYDTGVKEENYTIPNTQNNGADSVNFKKIKGKTVQETYTTGINGENMPNLEYSLTKVLNMDRLQKATFEAQYKAEIQNTPIEDRVSTKMIKRLLDNKLKENNIDIAYEFAILKNTDTTTIKSKSFEASLVPTIGVPIFLDENGESEYGLYINFPSRKRFIMSSIIGMTSLSILFTIIIIIAYTSALYQLIQQRKISQMKSDFINNMTHEFKTPIATINLALDAIKNPKIFQHADKVKNYLSMIKEENKRMNAQVENVLRISQLQKKQLIISKDRLKLHDLILDAITHVELIVEDRKGYIKTHFKASKSSILANSTYLTNVIVNVLDNAVKYSDNSPKIDITTENVGNNILMLVKDQGIGMSKAVQKRIFEEFYREHTGDVHNVKGHGLGLSNVKRIVENHQGTVTVESEKGKGSTFIIKLPLIA
ncbi:HAMP domain-containing histidine kinase, partial [Flavobacteriaceae bacterium]|nr:HAMP domain-containing histidine kinase [Flavobacteriaceae bacterium]